MISRLAIASALCVAATVTADDCATLTFQNGAIPDCKTIADTDGSKESCDRDCASGCGSSCPTSVCASVCDPTRKPKYTTYASADTCPAKAAMGENGYRYRCIAPAEVITPTATSPEVVPTTKSSEADREGADDDVAPTNATLAPRVLGGSWHRPTITTTKQARVLGFRPGDASRVEGVSEASDGSLEDGTDDHDEGDHSHDGEGADHSHDKDDKILDSDADKEVGAMEESMENSTAFAIGIAFAAALALIFYAVYTKFFKKSATSRRYSAFGGSPKKPSLATLNEAFVGGNSSAGNAEEGEEEEVFARG